MSESTNKVAELRAQLAEAEKVEKAEKAAKRQAERDARNAKLATDTEAFREENYTFTAGDHSGYLGVISNYNGSIEVGIAEWSSSQSSVTLSREQALALIANLQEIVK